MMDARILAVLVLCSLMLDSVRADCYMHHPRGSNDRLNEASQTRNNDNRLFRSENNGEGGYCWGPPVSYYAGSILPVEWTSQHACNNENVQCNMVLQYYCSNDAGDDSQKMRDGTTTTTITDDPNQYNKKNTDGTFVYGMHESYNYYQMCKQRERNKGLFVADQNVGDSATHTRQEPGGTQFGFECNEESAYYPYWHPAPWKDIAVMVPDTNMCGYFQSNSQNKQAKNYCDLTVTGNTLVPNNQQGCEAAGGKWTSQSAWNIAAPACVQAPYSRDNHLGNGVDGVQNSFNWTLPDAKTEGCIGGSTCSCALRIRYNISTANTDNWGFVDSKSNGANSPVTQDPNENIEGGELTLALNTNQYGRTFQDRSYIFHIIPRPNHVSSTTKIYNLGVRGKRGNIVQVFPATEYDFVPTTLHAEQGDYIHFQWTGCDTNPAGNAGEGIDQTDRSNIVQVQSRNSNIPLDKVNMTASKTSMLFEDDGLRRNMAYIGQTNCPTIAQLLAKNNNNQGQVNIDPTNCAKLNAAATPYFNGGLVKMNNTGTFYYMSTRNNNFSNRSQKGTIIIKPKLSGGQIAGIVIGVLAFVAVVSAVVVFVVVAKKKPHSWAGRTWDKIPFVGGKSPNFAPTNFNSVRKEPLLSTN